MRRVELQCKSCYGVGADIQGGYCVACWGKGKTIRFVCDEPAPFTLWVLSAFLNMEGPAWYDVGRWSRWSQYDYAFHPSNIAVTYAKNQKPKLYEVT